MALLPLFPVTQQFQAKNGSNLVGGKVYIYYQGRTALATTYHDAEGTVVNPNPVLLDNNGRATVFADTIYSYTIVVCDYYGKELFSQDITLHDAISTAEDVIVMGSNGSVKVDTTTLPNGEQYDLSVNTDIIATNESVNKVKTDLNTLTGTVNNHTTQIGQIQGDINGIESTVANKKDKQSELNFNGSATKTVKKITQNANGELNVEFEAIDLPQEVPNVNITSEDNSIKVTETTDVQTNTKKFDLSVQGGGTTYSAGNAIDLTNNTISVKYGKGLENTTDNKLQLKVGEGLTLGNDTLEVTFKDLETSITDFRTGDVIPVDGPDGIAKMAKDTLLAITDESAVKTSNDVRNYLSMLSLGESVVKYVDGAGNLADAGVTNRHFVVPVSSGNTYKVRTRLGSSTMWIAGGDTADQTTGLTKYKNDSINYGSFVDYIIKATKPYLFISFTTPSRTSPYTQSDVFVNVEDVTDSNGIVPNGFTTDGFRPQSSSNKLSSSGLIVCYNHRTPNKKLSRIRFNASGDGFIRFGVGLIDQRNWAIISQTIDVPCKAGYNDVDVLKFGLDFQQGGYLFAYNNADGNGTCVTYTIVNSGNLYGMFFAETPSSAINKTINSSGVIINAKLGSTNSNAQANMSWDALDETLLYRLDSEALADKAWNERTINAVAQAKGTKNLIASGRSKYKISQSSGSLVLSPFKFKAVTIYSNSIFMTGASSGWLYPQTIGGVTYTYTNEPDPQSMGGMRGRGMSATRQGVDFKHIFRDAVQALDSTTIVRGASVADVERGNADGTFKDWSDTGFGYLCDSTNDLIIWAAGENVIRTDDEYYAALCSWVEYWQTRSPNALIVLCGRYWKNDVCDYITYRVAQKYALPFVWKRMDEDTQSRADQIVIYPAKGSDDNEVELVGRVNVGAGHPSDVGMYRIARLILETVGVECPDLEHKIVCQNSTTDLVHIPKTWVYGGIVSIEVNGDSSPSISVVTASGTSVSVNVKAKAEIGSYCNYVVYFDMPNEDVMVTFN